MKVLLIFVACCFLITLVRVARGEQNVFVMESIEEQKTQGKINIDGYLHSRDAHPVLLEEDSVKEDKMRAYLSRVSEHDDKIMNVTCDLCEFVVKQVQNMLREGRTVDAIINAIIDICIKFKVEDERVCHLVVHQFQEQAIYVITNLILEPKEACGIILGDACATPYFPGESWNITLPSTPKPTPTPPKPPKPESPKLRVLHLTDIHIDFLYREGAEVACGEPLCCRVNDQPNATLHSLYFLPKSKGAGKYGDYEFCDAPMTLVDNLFRHLYTIQDQFDYIIFTGDIPAHDVWNQSQSDQIEHILTLDKMFSKYLPNKPVYSCVGNHESSPVNSFIQPGIPGHSMDWLYGALATVWGKWLPQSALDTVLKCGGYSVSPYPGFRIISVNDNYCNKGSAWLLLNSTDPCDVLQWLVQELQSAENKGEKVHILTHIPPGESVCLQWWSFNYYKIVNRYENTIVNQFYGHSHHDWFEMFYDDVKFQRPVGVGFVAPSVTVFSFNNPNYRIYTVDGNYNGSSWAVLDYSNYYFNLTKANTMNDPLWDFEYSPKTAYGMKGLYPADWEDLIQRMEKDDVLFQKFYRFNQNQNPRTPCHGNCKTKLLCRLKEGRSYDPELCDIHK